MRLNQAVEVIESQRKSICESRRRIKVALSASALRQKTKKAAKEITDNIEPVHVKLDEAYNKAGKAIKGLYKEIGYNFEPPKYNPERPVSGVVRFRIDFHPDTEISNAKRLISSAIDEMEKIHSLKVLVNERDLSKKVEVKSSVKNDIKSMINLLNGALEEIVDISVNDEVAKTEE